MHFAILTIFWLLIFFSLLYILLIVTMTIGWFQIKDFKGNAITELPDVSVVIAVRNEEKNIIRLLHNLEQQDFPLNQLEIILINDHSSDKTAEIIKQYINDHKALDIKLIHASVEGKKASINKGIMMAKYDLIVTTDGDCAVGVNWLRRLLEYYQLKEPKLVVGPVVYEQIKGFLQQFYTLDFMSLVASGAGSLGAGLPLMANGANLLYTKHTYLDLVENQSGKSCASGDDVFLLHAAADRYGAKSIHFLKDPSTIVHTNPPENLVAFLSQRKRWASKAVAYRSVWAILVSISVFSLSLMLVLSFLTAFLKPWFLLIFGLFVLLKIMIDFPLLQYFAEFSNRKKAVPYLFLFGFIYPFYIVIAGFSSLFFRFNWKGRNNIK